ncbi:RDD family protein [Brevibacillus sp. SYP-B805]|uniref:RDD family protein n=1 Tax=Brevibacillus sp. SYP-B805 TaxID=1578199 RepID=UPI0013EBA106|nr:RDD family protein [Brevibacillus sp. SYP-B805]NGQ95127.1 RDD family protein [Brevibacillus sp. SYP-B805]
MDQELELKAPLQAEELKYAGFWIRFLAYVIDGILLYVVTFLLVLVHEKLVFLSYLISILYFPLLESSSMQGTLGKKALGLIVVDEEGNRITVGRAFGRFFAKILSGIILYIGYIMVAFTEKKQGLHDKIVSTYVVKK